MVRSWAPEATWTPSSQFVVTLSVPIDPVHPFCSLTPTGVLFVIVTVTESRWTGPEHVQTWFVTTIELLRVVEDDWAPATCEAPSPTALNTQRMARSRPILRSITEASVRRGFVRKAALRDPTSQPSPRHALTEPQNVSFAAVGRCGVREHPKRFLADAP